MASAACANNIGMSPENFLDCSYAWLTPRISFSEDSHSPSSSNPPASESADPQLSDFEFRLQDPVAIMLPADQLFLDGKLVPLHLHLSSLNPSVEELKSTRRASSPAKSRLRVEDPYLFSPKAPRCSSRWRDLLGLKKLTTGAKNENHKTTSSSSSYFSEANSKALKYFLHRTSKSSSSFDASITLPLLKDSDSESVSLSSSRVSLSSAHELEDLHRLSLDCDNKPNSNPAISLHRNPNPNPPRMRLVKPRPKSDINPTAAPRVGRSPMRRPPGESASRLGIRGVSVDSPRMNSSGKIVFHNLERSSSSPSTFNGGPKFKQRGMERSYSANVRVTPVLNVPLCSSLRGSSKSVSVFGFGQLFSGSGGSSSSSRTHHHHQSSTNRTTTRLDQTAAAGKNH